MESIQAIKQFEGEKSISFGLVRSSHNKSNTNRNAYFRLMKHFEESEAAWH